MTTRAIDYCGIVPILEPLDSQAGIVADSFHMGRAAHADIILQFGAVTGDAVLSLYQGATAAALTTLVPFRYRLSSGDYKAASADLWAASDTTDADGQLTLTAATYDHRLLAIMLDAPEIAEATPWVTVDISAASTVLLLSGLVLLTHARYKPPLTAIA